MNRERALKASFAIVGLVFAASCIFLWFSLESLMPMVSTAFGRDGASISAFTLFCIKWRKVLLVLSVAGLAFGMAPLFKKGVSLEVFCLYATATSLVFALVLWSVVLGWILWTVPFG
jgi:hypothetical protein